MDPLQQQFDDPALRSAIRRATGKSPAPKHLRDNVAAMMASAAIASGASTSRSPSRWRLPRLEITPRIAAVAAVALIAVSVAGYQVVDFVGDLYPHAPPVASAALSASVTSSMSSAHDALAKQKDHAPVAKVDYDSLRSTLSKETNVAAFAAPLGDGWDLQGSGVADIDGHKAAQVVYARNGQAASVFSFPASDSACGGDHRGCQQNKGRAIASLARSGTMYAVEITSTGGAEPTSAEADSILNTVSTAVASSTTAPAGSTAH